MNTIRVKACGITTVADAELCARLRVDYLGVIFAPSPRRITPAQARRIRDAAPDVSLVGVFVNEDVAIMQQIAAEAGLDCIQLHGNEDATCIATLRRRTGLPVIKALRAGELLGARAWDAACTADFVLLDRAKGQHTRGPRFLDDEAARAAAAGFRVFLAGGLAPDNVRRLSESARPWAVDVCSGVEREAGMKDDEALERFVAEVRH